MPLILLDASRVEEVQLLVIAIDDADKIIEIAAMTKKYYPHLSIVARVIDRRQTYELMKLGITSFKREIFDSALNLGIEALLLLGNIQES
jgi:glutathione-regulated potassium-efflux system ancillary protein KefC/glutathione-regulated potassium-efflux system protein KefB